MAGRKSCSLPVAIDSLYTCSGLCKCEFHFTCLGVSRAVAQELKRSESPLLWMCQACRSGSHGGWAAIRDLIAKSASDMKRELGELLERHLARLPQPIDPARSLSTTRLQHHSRQPVTNTPTTEGGTHTPTVVLGPTLSNSTNAGELVATNTAKPRLPVTTTPVLVSNVGGTNSSTVVLGSTQPSRAHAGEMMAANTTKPRLPVTTTPVLVSNVCGTHTSTAVLGSTQPSTARAGDLVASNTAKRPTAPPISNAPHSVISPVLTSRSHLDPAPSRSLADPVACVPAHSSPDA
uniref:Uncharacterized protein n=1 Tax=Anopheles atroparvus TaxID=41427 RepID=A0A182J1L5_ANOAO